MNFTILGRDTVYNGRAFDVQKVYLQLPDATKKHYDLVVHAESVTILPLDSQGNVYFVRQFRLGAGGDLLELPAGILDEGEDALTGARREIQEETGMGCDSMQLLGDFYMSPGYCDEHMHLYLAKNIYPSYLSPDPDEFLTVEKIRLREAIEMVHKGEIKDMKSVTAILLALPYLKSFFEI